MNVLDLILECSIEPGRSIGRKRERHCACPGCGGADRFRIWPEDNNGSGSYNCMGGAGCGLKGDNVQFCRDFLGLEFKEAAEKCGRFDLLSDEFKSGKKSRRSKPLQSPKTNQSDFSFKPNSYDLPNSEWTLSAHDFAVKCNAELLKRKSTMTWLAHRGIDEAAVRRYCLGWNQGDNGKPLYKSRLKWGLPLVSNEKRKNKPLWIPVGLVIPYFVDNEVVRLRIRRPKSERERNLPDLKFYVIPGSYMGTMVLKPDCEAHVIVEAELCGIACASACDEVGAISVMTIEGKPDSFAFSVLKKDLKILNALDYGDTGQVKKVAKRANEWWVNTFTDICSRWPVPKGKDPGEAVACGVDLAVWIKAGLPPVFSLGSKAEPVIDQNEVPRQSEFDLGDEKEVAKQGVEVKIPDVISELAGLLKASGVMLNKREGGQDLGIIKPDDYDLEKYHQRIDELVFQSVEVGLWIFNLPDGLIGPKGLVRKG